MTARTPPSIVFLGTEDRLIPVTSAREFELRMKRAGVRCRLELYAGDGHPIYNYQKPSTSRREQILEQADDFLSELGF